MFLLFRSVPASDLSEINYFSSIPINIRRFKYQICTEDFFGGEFPLVNDARDVNTRL